MANDRVQFVDTWLIYRSDEDPGLWVAHSLNTDQLALGDCVVEAMVALKRVMAALLEMAAEDPTVEIISPAPA